MLPQSHFIALKKTNIFSNALRDFAFTLSAAWPPGLLLWHRWRNLFQSEEAQMHVEKKLLHNFLFWLRNCDITCIEIWRLFLYTIWRSKFHYFRQNYTTVTTYRWTTSNSNRLLHGRTRSSASLGRIIRFILNDWIKPFEACVTEISICFHSGWDYRCQPEWKQIEKKRAWFNNLVKWDHGWRNKLTKQASLRSPI